MNEVSKNRYTVHVYLDFHTVLYCSKCDRPLRLRGTDGLHKNFVSEPSNQNEKSQSPRCPIPGLDTHFFQIVANTISMGTKINVSEIAKPFRDDVKAKVAQLKASGLGMSLRNFIKNVAYSSKNTMICFL